jgi:HEPN domain-containing protein
MRLDPMRSNAAPKCRSSSDDHLHRDRIETVSQPETKDASLRSRLAEIDKQFIEQSMPVRRRPLEAFKLLHGSVPDGERRNSLFAPIAAWFIERYGKRAEWDGVVARIPLLLRGNLYLLAVPFVGGDAILRLTDFIEGLPQEIAETMTQEEFDVWGEKAMLAASSVYKIYNLSVDDLHFSTLERELLRRALFDLENASTSLKVNEDTQGAVFNAHAAAEKFLKVGLKRAGLTADMISHDLPKIFEKLVNLRADYSWLRGAVEALQAFAPKMEIRYRVVPRSVENAVSAIHISLNICSMLAQTWLFDLARGGQKSQFSSGRYYIDGRHATFYCDRPCTSTTGRPAAVLMAFADAPLIGPLIAKMVIEQEHSSLYLEVTDSRQVEELKSQFEALRKRCQNPVDPKTIGIDIHSSPEGSYAGGVIHVRRERP